MKWEWNPYLYGTIFLFSLGFNLGPGKIRTTSMVAISGNWNIVRHLHLHAITVASRKRDSAPTS